MITNDMRIMLDACHAHPEDDLRLGVAADYAQDQGCASLTWILQTLRDVNAARRLPTGSRIYGRPTDASDWDWVLDCPDNRWAVQKMWGPDSFVTECSRRADAGTWKPGDLRLYASARYGPVNVIVCVNTVQFDYWTEARNICVRHALHAGGSLDRDVAVRLHNDHTARTFHRSDFGY